VTWLIVVLPVVALTITLLNLVWWPRGRRRGLPDRSVSILIPARDEAPRIERCVRAALACAGATEVVVYDDQSTDDTAAIVERIAAEDPRMKLVRGAPLPPGWVGKAHACHVLAQHASGARWLFVDADTVLDPSALERYGDLEQRYDAAIVTAVPRQRTETVAERIVMPMLHVTYTSWLFQPLVWATKNVRFLAANGQFLAIRPDAYRQLGGFEAVRDAVVEDMALCRHAKTNGRRVVFADGRDLAECRMYTGWSEIWSGFSKNLYLGVGGNAWAVLFVVALYLATFVLPFVSAPWLGLPALVAIAANIALRIALALRFGHTFSSVLLHPLGALAVVAIALNSWRWAVAGGIQWRGRVYEVT
jgi:chlorobactene glucosyltransferase